jgi:hypothetical protein
MVLALVFYSPACAELRRNHFIVQNYEHLLTSPSYPTEACLSADREREVGL